MEIEQPLWLSREAQEYWFRHFGIRSDAAGFVTWLLQTPRDLSAPETPFGDEAEASHWPSRTPLCLAGYVLPSGKRIDLRQSGGGESYF
jgi:hypothetical protein